jgi:hypothetical protein
LEALGYFIEGSACEPGEEVVLDPGDDEAVMFEEFFAARLQMPPQPVLTNIFVLCLASAENLAVMFSRSATSCTISQRKWMPTGLKNISSLTA